MPVLTLGDPRLSVISNPYAVDGRVSWHAPDVRGFAPSNVYVLREGTRALVVDTGLTVHRAAVLADLEVALDGVDDVEVFTLRQGEFDSICNLLPIVERFGVRTVHGQFEEALRWADFDPVSLLHPLPAAIRDGVETNIVSRRAELSLGGDRTLLVVRPSLRLLTTHWIYDAATRTLMTSDAFGYAVASTLDGPWLVTEDDDDLTGDDVLRHLLGTRFWWLADSEVSELREELAGLAALGAEAIAPAFGRPLLGADVVARHWDLLDRALVALESDRMTTEATR